MGWKESLDRYLTTPPESEIDSWYEDLIQNQISSPFYEENEHWIFEGGLFQKWVEMLFAKGIDTPQSAAIIERAFKINQLKIKRNETKHN